MKSSTPITSLVLVASTIMAKTKTWAFKPFNCQPYMYVHLQQDLKRPFALSTRSESSSTKFYYKNNDTYDKVGVIALDSSSWLAQQDHDGATPTQQPQSGRINMSMVPSRSISRVDRTINNIRSMLEDAFSRSGKGNHSGTKAHIAVLSVVTASYVMFMKKCVGTKLCRAVMSVTSLSLMYDNLIMAMGKYIGEGAALRKLSKLRSVAHGLCIPLTFLPILEIIPKHGLASASVVRSIGCLVVGITVHEVFHWMCFDHEKLILVDNRHSAESTARTMPGMMHYTSGKILKMLLPVAILEVLILGVGSMLWRRGAAAGLWMVGAGLVSLITCSLQRPGVQALGETMMVSLLWHAVNL